VTAPQTPPLFDYGPTTNEMHRSAVLSGDSVYRYSLARWWDSNLPRDLWVMCNASTANHEIDDPTVTRCFGFSRRFGSGGFAVCNAYGFRASKPAAMWAAERGGVDIVGPENDGWLRAHLITEAGRVIVAWGAHPKPARARQVLKLIHDAGREALCLGTTKDGQPRHPLYVRAAAELVSYGVPR
jgi:hypothetical protein